MREPWPHFRLDELPIQLLDGDRSKNYIKRDELVASGVPFFNSSCFQDGRIVESELSFAPEDKAARIKKGRAIAGDIVLTTRGTLGKIVRVPSHLAGAIINAQMLIFRADGVQVDQAFLFQAMRSELFQSALLSFSSGSAQPQIPMRDLRAVTVPLPPLPIQKRIAAILSAYDDLIEVNTRRIALLEEMARRTYEEWFVRGADPAWTIGSVADLGQVITGKTPSKKRPEFWGNGTPFLKLPDMHGQVMVSATGESLSHTGAASQQNKLIPARSVCVSCIGTAGIVVINAVPCHTNQQINSVVPDKSKRFPFVYFSLRMLKPLILAYGATGATMANLSRGKLAALPVTTPPEPLIDDFCERAIPMFDLIEVLETQNTNLRAQRDLLLPRLVSGRLDVSKVDVPNAKEPAHA